MAQLIEYIKDQIWIHEYPVRFMRMDLYARMSVIRLANGDLIIHDPCHIDAASKRELDALGKVKYIIAPGNFHHLSVQDFQQIYPEAETFLCPGLERKRADIRFDWILGNCPDPRWAEVLDQVVVQGTKIIWEVVFSHRSSKTLILVDLLENIGDDYQHSVNLYLRFWWKLIFHMWNRPKPAPEYQMGWGNKHIVKRALNTILAWQADRVILAHGELIEDNVKDVLSAAWEKVLNA